MDPVSAIGLVAGIVQLIDATSKVVDYVNDVREAVRERVELAQETKLMLDLLIKLKAKAEQNEASQSWQSNVVWLSGPDGPLNLLKMAMEEMASKLERAKGVNGVKRFGRDLIWPRTKEQINRLLAQMERTKSLINLALSDELLTMSKDMKAETALIKDDLLALRQSMSGNEDSRRREIADWISPATVDYAIQQGDIISRRQEGTGSWIHDSREFATWLKSQSSTLFCPGIPGAGKSMMAAIVIEHLWNMLLAEGSSTNCTGVCFVIFDFKRREEQGIAHIIAALLKQLMQEQPSVPEAVNDLYQLHSSRRSRPSPDELYQALRSVAINYTRLFVVLDALDECASANGTLHNLLGLIFKLQTEAEADVKLLATSRSIHDIEERFKEYPTLEIKASYTDLHTYLMDQMSLLPKCVSKSQDLQKTIVSKIVEAADGMFLLARLHMESLKDKINPKIIKNALSQLSNGSDNLDIAYKDAIERIQAQPAGLRDVAQQAISWIVHAKRRLTTVELQEALAIEPGSKSLDNDNFTEIEDIVNSCAGLVTIDDESHIIRLVHYTTEVYFQKNLGHWISDAPKRIAVACLTYLTLDTFATGACDTDEEFEARLASNVFLGYASSHWADHLIDSGTQVHDLALQFLLEGSLVQNATQALSVGKYRYSGYSQEYPKDATGLHLAAETGHEAVVKLLLARSDMDINAVDFRGNTPLIYAATRGHEAVVKILLAQSNIDINASSNFGQTPLIYVTMEGHVEVTNLLLARSDLDVNANDANGWTPLICAAVEGHDAVAKLLLDRSDIDVNKSDCIWQTPLSYAATRGHAAVVKLLLAQSDINVNASGKDGETPLFYAAERGHEAVMKLLLARSDINVNASNKYGRTPLSLAAEAGREGAVKLLLDRSDVDVNVRDTRTGRTACSYAAWRGHEAVVKLFRSRPLSNQPA